MPARNFPLILSLALLGGCISFGAKPPPSLLTLTPAQVPPAGAGQTIAPGEAITVEVPQVPQALATPRVPVQATATSLAYVKDAQWVDEPKRLFQQLLSATIAARTGRPVLSPRQYSADPGTRLGGQLLDFGLDAQTNMAVVIYDAVLQHGTDIQTRRFQAKVPVASIDAAGAGAALNQAANEVAAQVADWVGK